MPYRSSRSIPTPWHRSTGATPGPARVGLESLPHRLGRYEIIRLLGRGGMGSVYLALDLSLRRQVALKVMEGAGPTVGNAMKRFLREARAVAGLRHPGIMQIYDIGKEEDTLFLALEYVGGGTLSGLLRSRGPMEPESAARLVLGLAQAVQSAHEQGVIHRDLKPANILMTENGLTKISDFGLARLAYQIEADEVRTEVGRPIGTPGYMAPEQVRGDPQEIGAPTDVYGLGTILYECLTHAAPSRANR